LFIAVSQGNAVWHQFLFAAFAAREATGITPRIDGPPLAISDENRNAPIPYCTLHCAMNQAAGV
jgi:hypothetical protein